MKPLLVFDLDGTLADTSHDLITALNKVLVDNLNHPVEAVVVQPLISKGVDGMLGAGFGSAYAAMSDKKKQELVKAFVAYYEQEMLNKVVLYPGVKPVLDMLNEQGFKMAICSNKNTRLVECILEYLQIRPHFLAVCGGDFFVGIKKPDHRHVEGTMREAGFDATLRNAIFIGDAMSDMKAAKNTGIPSVFVTYGYADVTPSDSGANCIAHQADELPEAISSLVSYLALGKTGA
ncbi:MAG: HAD-IA family hydrolase [Burkholderiales bacterium]|nr:HAD-IA family hydrolase [Burkholderiales bacterium]